VLNNPDKIQHPTVYLKINVPADSATNTYGPATQGADDNNLTVTHTTSGSASSPQDGSHVGSGSTAPLIKETVDDADQAVNSMQPAMGMAVTTANVITTTLDAIDGVVCIYQTWEKVVATMEAVMVVVDKIAEVKVGLSTYS
jgi:hypothetical protein